MGVASVRLLVVGLLVGQVVALPGPAAASGTSAAGQSQGPPNILLITTDDQNVRDMRYLPRTVGCSGARA